MTSIAGHYSQRLTRTFKVAKSGGTLFLQSDINAWYGDRKSVITKLGNTYVLEISSTNDFADIVDGGDVPSTGASALSPNGPSLPISTSLKDMGKEIRIGTSEESALLVLRLVQLPGPAANNGAPDNVSANTGYVVVANNTNDVFDTVDNFKVYVSRV